MHAAYTEKDKPIHLEGALFLLARACEAALCALRSALQSQVAPPEAASSAALSVQVLWEGRMSLQDWASLHAPAARHETIVTKLPCFKHKDDQIWLLLCAPHNARYCQYSSHVCLHSAPMI